MKGKRAIAFVPLLLLVGAGVGVFAGALGAPFIFDDLTSIPQNPCIRQIWPPWKALASPPWITALAGRPLVRLSLAVNYALGGLDVRGYHVFNLALHVLTALVLYAILERVLGRPRVSPWIRDHARALATVIALLWLVHPLQTETVAYVIVRSELLASLFYVATLFLAIRSWESATPGRWHVAAVAACALGMLSKEIMVSAPFFVLLFDRTFVSGSFHAAWKRSRGLYLGLAGTWLILAALVASGEQIRGSGLDSGGFSLASSLGYLNTQARVLLHYLRLCFWPTSLRLVYDFPPATPFREAAPAFLVIGGLFAGTVWAVLRRSWVGVVGALFFLVLAPTSSVLPLRTEIAAERRMHLPLISVVILVVLAVHAAAARARRSRAKPVLGTEAALTGLAVMVLGGVSVARLRQYETPLRIWSDAVARSPRSPVAHNNYAGQLVGERRLNEASDHLEEAVRLDPGYADAYQNLGMVDLLRGDAVGALEHLRRALQLAPDRPDVQFLLASALSRLGQHRTAIPHYRRSLALNPDDPGVLSGLAESLAETGELAEAERLLEETLRLRTGQALDHRRLGDVLRKAGRADAAIAHYREALRLDPRLATVHWELGRLLLGRGETREGLRHSLMALAGSDEGDPRTAAMWEEMRGWPQPVWDALANLARSGEEDETVRRAATRALREIPKPNAQASW